MTATTRLRSPGKGGDVEGRGRRAGELGEETSEVRLEHDGEARHPNPRRFEARSTGRKPHDRSRGGVGKRVVRLQALRRHDRGRVGGEDPTDSLLQSRVFKVLGGERAYRDRDRDEGDDSFELPHLDERSLRTAAEDPAAGRSESARSGREETVPEFERDGSTLGEVVERDRPGRPNHVDPLDPFPEVVAEPTKRLVEPRDPLDRRSIATFSDGHEPASTQLAIRMGHRLDGEAEPLGDRPELGRLESRALVEKQKLGHRAAPSERGKATHIGRPSGNHGPGNFACE